MRDKNKIRYEKPTAVSLGPSDSIVGQPESCSVGTNATSDCSFGSDVAVIPYCPSGSIATGNCYPEGAQAGQACLTVGNVAGLGCLAGNTP